MFHQKIHPLQPFDPARLKGPGFWLWLDRNPEPSDITMTAEVDWAPISEGFCAYCGGSLRPQEIRPSFLHCPACGAGFRLVQEA